MRLFLQKGGRVLFGNNFDWVCFDHLIGVTPHLHFSGFKNTFCLGGGNYRDHGSNRTQYHYLSIYAMLGINELLPALPSGINNRKLAIPDIFLVKDLGLFWVWALALFLTKLYKGHLRKPRKAHEPSPALLSKLVMGLIGFRRRPERLLNYFQRLPLQMQPGYHRL